MTTTRRNFLRLLAFAPFAPQLEVAAKALPPLSRAEVFRLIQYEKEAAIWVAMMRGMEAQLFATPRN